MILILGSFFVVILMLVLGWIGELLFSSSESEEDGEELEELKTQNILDQLS